VSNGNKKLAITLSKVAFCKIVKNTFSDGPQNITLRGESVVVIISKTQYDSLVKPHPTFVKFMQKSPLVDIKLDLKRNPSPTRNVEL
jgi:prevent-host-death family protein